MGAHFEHSIVGFAGLVNEDKHESTKHEGNYDKSKKKIQREGKRRERREERTGRFLPENSIISTRGHRGMTKTKQIICRVQRPC